MGKLRKPLPSEIVFEVKSQLGALVKTTHSYWKIITQVKHPSIQGKEKLVKEVLRVPDEIRVSKKDNKVYLFYKKYAKKLLCVVARIDDNEGFIITVYYTEKIKEGELKWKK